MISCFRLISRSANPLLQHIFLYRAFSVDLANRHLYLAEDCQNDLQICSTNLAESRTYTAPLTSCASLKKSSDGRCLHAYSLKNGSLPSEFVLTGLVKVYAKCGSVKDARQLFDEMSGRNVATWNAMISAYAQHKCENLALDLFWRMQCLGIRPSQFTFSSILRSCAALTAVDSGAQIHGLVFKAGFNSDVFIASALIDMYAKCGDMDSAQSAFDEMEERDAVSWNAILAGYSRHGDPQSALLLFRDMHQLGLSPNQFVLSSVLKVCASSQDLKSGRQIHAYSHKTGFAIDVFVAGSLVDLYSKSGDMKDARSMFERMPLRDIVAWTAMMVGYAKNGFASGTLELFYEMQTSGVKPAPFPVASVLSACANLEALCQGKQIHGYILKHGFDSDLCVMNALIDMYAKSGCIDKARKVFDNMAIQDVASWNAIIAGHTQNGLDNEALETLQEMQRNNFLPNVFTFGSVLKACATLATLERGKVVHSLIVKSGLELHVIIDCSLVNMYAKCGKIEDAEQVFETSPKEDAASWNAMISAYAQHGLECKVIQSFDTMQFLGIKPDVTTFVIVLFACSHLGLVEKGWCFFDSMENNYGLKPELDHYICMVDLLGRAGHLNEAEAFIDSMPFKPDALVWKTLLSACRVHGNREIGKRAAEHILRLDPLDHSAYILLANIHASSSQLDGVVISEKDDGKEACK